MDIYSAALQIYNSFIGTAVVYGLLLAVVIFLAFARRSGFPYIHLGLVCICGIITQALVASPIITTADYGRVPGFLLTYLIFYSIQYLIMFLIPIHIAHQQSKQSANNQKKQKVAKRLAYTGYFLAFIVVALLIVALIFFGSINGSSYSNYQKVYTFGSLYLAYTLLHWAFVLLWLTIAITLRKEISSIGTFAGFGFLLILMMVGVTINVIGGGVQNAMMSYTVFWAHLFLYHVCCFIATLIASYFGTIWVQANSVNNIEPSA
ncbi:unnamed protein product [Cunninghamella echinulata]